MSVRVPVLKNKKFVSSQVKEFQDYCFQISKLIKTAKSIVFEFQFSSHNVKVWTSEGKILENVSLEVDLNIENFRGLPLKSPWIIIPNSPLNFIPWPWKLWPQTCLEIRGFSRVPLENPWNVFGTLILENPWNSRRRLPLTLIDPWNSTSRSRNLEIQSHNCTIFWDKALKMYNFWILSPSSLRQNFVWA